MAKKIVKRAKRISKLEEMEEMIKEAIQDVFDGRDSDTGMTLAELVEDKLYYNDEFNNLVRDVIQEQINNRFSGRVR